MTESVWGEALPLFLSATLLAIFVNYIGFKAGFFRPLSAPNYPRAPTLGDLIFTFFVYLTFNLLLFPFVVCTGFSIFFHEWVCPLSDLSKQTQMWIISLNLWVSIPFLWCLCYLFQPTTIKSVEESDVVKTKKEWLYHFSVGAMTWFIAYPVVLLLNLILSTVLTVFFHPEETDQVAVKLLKRTFDDPVQQVFFFSAIVIIVPILEEFIFRGIFQRWLCSHFGAAIGILGASLLFAAFHYAAAQGVYNWELLPALFLLSCYLGFLYERQRSLWAPIGLHTTFNLVSASLLILQG